MYAHLETLVVPAPSTIGAQLLRALGWKEGQGVGPKVTKYQQRQGRVIISLLPISLASHTHLNIAPSNV